MFKQSDHQISPSEQLMAALLPPVEKLSLFPGEGRTVFGLENAGIVGKFT